MELQKRNRTGRTKLRVSSLKFLSFTERSFSLRAHTYTGTGTSKKSPQGCRPSLLLLRLFPDRIPHLCSLLAPRTCCSCSQTHDCCSSSRTRRGWGSSGGMPAKCERRHDRQNRPAADTQHTAEALLTVGDDRPERVFPSALSFKSLQTCISFFSVPSFKAFTFFSLSSSSSRRLRLLLEDQTLRSLFLSFSPSSTFPASFLPHSDCTGVEIAS